MHIISTNSKISKLADLESSVKGSKLIIGERCMIDAFVKIKFSGGLGDIIIGNNCYINSGTVIYSGNGIVMGNYVLIAANCTLSASNHEFISKDKTVYDQRFKTSRGGIIIEDDVWIGANTVISEGAILREGAIIGACSFVNKEIESYGIYVGNPLRKIGERK
ncbi:MAG: acyltransferase [Saprospiraceae bacterium]|nr:acyltransferase [Saprospiraceae bacterium]MBK9992775.1 acyltransferase [Saprospiraceae bacterium]